jgi:hypothetical protein
MTLISEYQFIYLVYRSYRLNFIFHNYQGRYCIVGFHGRDDDFNLKSCTRSIKTFYILPLLCEGFILDINYYNMQYTFYNHMTQINHDICNLPTNDLFVVALLMNHKHPLCLC